MKKVKLPNGKKIFCIDKMSPKAIHYELYNDENIYLRQGITVKDGDTVFDVGANIGQFSLYLCEHYKNLQIYTFEPIPEIFKVLLANLSGVNARVTNYNLGLAEKEAMMDFHYYPKATVYSSIHQIDMEKQKHFFLDNYSEIRKNMLPLRLLPESCKYFIVKIFQLYFKSIKKACKTATISRVIEENNIQQIDLIKMDAENSEKEVIDGIREKDWQKTRQFSIEVHGCALGRESPLEYLKALLIEKGFTVNTYTDAIMAQVDVAMLYAVRV